MAFADFFDPSSPMSQEVRAYGNVRTQVESGQALSPQQRRAMIDYMNQVYSQGWGGWARNVTGSADMLNDMSDSDLWGNFNVARDHANDRSGDLARDFLLPMASFGLVGMGIGSLFAPEAGAVAGAAEGGGYTAEGTAFTQPGTSGGGGAFVGGPTTGIAGAEVLNEPFVTQEVTGPFATEGIDLTGGFPMPAAVPEIDPTFGGGLNQTFPGTFESAAPANFEDAPWDWRRRLRMGQLGLSGVSALMALNNARRAGRAPQVIDPVGYGPRAQYLEQLNALMRDPSSLQKTPGYNAGLQAVERRMASQGYTGSGNMQTALFDYGGRAFSEEVARLAALAGFNMPMASSGANQSFMQRANLQSSALATGGFGLRLAEELFI